MRPIRIGAGAGYSGDRIEPAVELVEHGRLDYLVFECLAERTIALAQKAKLHDGKAGFDPLLTERMMAVLPGCVKRGIRIITNMGAANPVEAAREVARTARSLGFAGLRVAAVIGDNVMEVLDPASKLLERPGTVASLGNRIVSANAYLGIDGIVDALNMDAQVIVTGRISDPALFVAPLVHGFGWQADDWSMLGQATVVGHLLECAGQVTGGYFADPGFKDVPDLARLGFPIAEVSADGSAILTKVPQSGGRITVATCKEQLVYEILDPAAYVQPDVIADFSQVLLTEIDTDRIAVTGGGGHPRPDQLKVSVGYRDSFVGEGQISYAGSGALARARLALDIVAERLKLTGVATTECRFELIGVNAVDVRNDTATSSEPREVRARVVARTTTMQDAIRIGNEVETLYTNGPAGGGGVTKSAKEVVAVVSTLIPRACVAPYIHIEVA